MIAVLYTTLPMDNVKINVVNTIVNKDINSLEIIFDYFKTIIEISLSIRPYTKNMLINTRITPDNYRRLTEITASQ